VPTWQRARLQWIWNVATRLSGHLAAWHGFTFDIYVKKF